MRQVFTSPRLENVEAVAELLRAEGIEVRISNDRSYRGKRRSNFSYRDGDDAGPQPAVWILNSEDQPRGRQLLREAGLLESSRSGESSYLPLPALDGGGTRTAEAGKRSRMRMRLVLLGLIGIVAVLIAFSLRDKPGAPPAASTTPATRPAPVIVPQSTDDLQVYRVEVPSALAKLLVEDALADTPRTQACIAIDDKDPSTDFMQALRHDAKTTLFAASACPGEAAYDINVHDYMTDGSGSGNVQLMLDVEDARTVDVERNGTAWRVLRVH